MGAFQYALQGTLRRMGPRVRVSVELIATDTGERFWGERYDADWDEVFATAPTRGSSDWAAPFLHIY
jgi:TolB-like protein